MTKLQPPLLAYHRAMPRSPIQVSIMNFAEIKIHEVGGNEAPTTPRAFLKKTKISALSSPKFALCYKKITITTYTQFLFAASNLSLIFHYLPTLYTRMPSVKRFLFGGTSLGSTSTEFALLVLRAFTGLAMALAHGWGKVPPGRGLVATVSDLGFPAPELFAWLAGLSELVGGICLAIGFCTRLSAFLIFTTMMVAAFGVHANDGFSGQEMALMYAAMTLPFLFAGCGKVGVDTLFRSS